MHNSAELNVNVTETINETVEYFLKTFYTKIRLSQGILPDIEPLKKIFLTMKHANKLQ